LIGLQQHTRRRRHQDHSHHEKETGECGNRAEDDRPYAVRSGVAVSRRDSPKIPVLMLMLAYLPQAHPKRPVWHSRSPGQARPAPRLSLPKIAIGHAAVETSCAIPKPSKWVGRANRD